MTVNYYVKCPVCESITRMRTPAGYIYSTPVRIHCGNCNTLLTGEFISDNKNIRAYYRAKNCQEVKPQKYQYYGEASGELLSKKIKFLPEDNEGVYFPPSISPVFYFFHSMNLTDKKNFINYACYISDVAQNWDVAQIKYKLFLEGKVDLIKDKFALDAKKIGYTLHSDFDVLRYVYNSFFFDCGGIFKEKEIKKTLLIINDHFRHFDLTELKAYIAFLDEKNRINTIQTKLFDIMFSFVKIVDNLIPAIGANLYDNPKTIDKYAVGISTCSFDDIKMFYQEAYENLAECCDIVIGLDNIESRRNYNLFTNKLNMEKFYEQSKGNKIKFLDNESFFAKTFNLASDSNELRNAIGHNDYNYNGIQQIIEYTVLSTGENKNSFLLDVAIECVKLMQSTYVLMVYVYEIQRYKERQARESVVLHPIFYSKTKNQEHCVCGSGRKYKDCCKSEIVEIKKNIQQYPNKSCMEANSSLFTNI